jgi:transposase
VPEWGQVAGDPGGPRSLVDGGADVHPLGAARRLGSFARHGQAAPRRTRDGLSGRHLDPGARQGGGGVQKGGTGAQRDAREALGRSRGGYGTKAVAVADSGGRAVAFALAPGQAHELPLAPDLLARLPRRPLWVVTDRGYAAHAFRDRVWSLGARPAVPAKRNEDAVACPAWVYHNRNRIERLWGRLKEWRAVATRYEKTARSFLGVLCLAASMDWLRR